jgi:hypothetical protein
VDENPDKLIFTGSDSQAILLVPELSCLVEKIFNTALAASQQNDTQLLLKQPKYLSC